MGQSGRVGVGRCEQDNYFERVQTPSDCRRFNSHRAPADVIQLDGRIVSYSLNSTGPFSASILARMSRGCYEENCFVEFKLIGRCELTVRRTLV